MTSNQKRLSWLFVVAAAVVFASYEFWTPDDSNGPAQPGVSNEQETSHESQAPSSANDGQERVQDARQCGQEALELVQHTAGERSAERDNKDLEARWIRYLERIQAQGDYANWSGKPCDLYLQNHESYASDAVARGFAAIEARGKDLYSVSVRVTITSNAGTTIVIPVGTQFASSSAGTQNMIAASSVAFTFAMVSPDDTDHGASILGNRRQAARNTGALLKVSYGGGRGTMRKVMFAPPPSPAPRTLELEVPSYCVNRWLEVPNPESGFSVSTPDETNPMRKLAACLEDNPADHGVKQAAVWMISDNLIGLTPQQLEDRFLDEGKSHFHPTAAALADLAKKADPSAGDDVIEGIKHMSPAELEEARSELLPRVLPVLKEKAAQQVQFYKDRAVPLLQGCGYDLSTSAFLRQ